LGWIVGAICGKFKPACKKLHAQEREDVNEQDHNGTVAHDDGESKDD
jgi:hypothetical protein